MKIVLPSLVLTILLFALINACTKNSDYNRNNSMLIRTWTVNMSAKNELTTQTGRTDSGTARLSLYSDNTLKFEITVAQLASGDVLTASHIHSGDAVTNGDVYIPFPGSFSANTLRGTLQLTAAQVDSLQKFPMYVNVYSTQFPNGIMRGQIDKNIIFAANVEMTGSNEVPPVLTSAAGTAYLRLADDTTLFSTVTVSNLESDDILGTAYVRHGVVGINGPVLIPLCSNTADFGISKKIPLTDAMVSLLFTDDVYVNVHTTSHPTGIIRGQIRSK